MCVNGAAGQRVLHHHLFPLCVFIYAHGDELNFIFSQQHSVCPLIMTNKMLTRLFMPNWFPAQDNLISEKVEGQWSNFFSPWNTRNSRSKTTYSSTIIHRKNLQKDVDKVVSCRLMVGKWISICCRHAFYLDTFSATLMHVFFSSSLLWKAL